MLIKYYYYYARSQVARAIQFLSPRSSTSSVRSSSFSHIHTHTYYFRLLLSSSNMYICIYTWRAGLSDITQDPESGSPPYTYAVSLSFPHYARERARASYNRSWIYVRCYYINMRTVINARRVETINHRTRKLSFNALSSPLGRLARLWFPSSVYPQAVHVHFDTHYCANPTSHVTIIVVILGPAEVARLLIAKSEFRRGGSSWNPLKYLDKCLELYPTSIGETRTRWIPMY